MDSLFLPTRNSTQLSGLESKICFPTGRSTVLSYGEVLLIVVEDLAEGGGDNPLKGTGEAVKEGVDEAKDALGGEGP